MGGRVQPASSATRLWCCTPTTNTIIAVRSINAVIGLKVSAHRQKKNFNSKRGRLQYELS